MFWAEIWKTISEFSSEKIPFLVVKFSIYLNRRNFLMYSVVQTALFCCSGCQCLGCLQQVFIPVSSQRFNFIYIFEPAHDKTYKMACAPSEHSDKPGHPPSLIRVFAVRMKKVWVPRYPLSAQRRLWSDWAEAQADLSLRWAHKPFCRFCHALAHLIHIFFYDVSHWVRCLRKAVLRDSGIYGLSFFIYAFVSPGCGAFFIFFPVYCLVFFLFSGSCLALFFLFK